MSALFIVGAQRSGSTYLYQMLDAHPEVLMAKPVRPEPKFFLNEDNFLQGKSFYEKKYFSNRRSMHKYIGEKSTSYIESRTAAERMQNFYPDAKILIILRNPVARAYSNYKFSVHHGIEKLSFLDAILMEKERLNGDEYVPSVNPYAYQQRGHYIDYIQEYLKVFDRTQIHIVIFEEFVGNLSSISSLYSYLGLSSDIIPANYQSRVNVSTVGDDYDSDFDNIREELCKGFEQSICKLEGFLGRKVDVWRES